ncbi:hypothetical protein [Vibrio anguillarum]|uniref:hypothetical protein n=1 Tax=Vibrio anguillarum TaxID=55601 RepID=UPI0012FDDDFE|nr:hypothetical protein [Vibrio anguillarum]
MKLLNGGYQAGQRFNIESDEGTLKIIPDREGKYTVSRRLRNGKTLPIIDISVDIIAKMFEGIECLTIRICEAAEVLGQGVIHTAFESLAYYLELRLNSLINPIELV